MCNSFKVKCSPLQLLLTTLFFFISFCRCLEYIGTWLSYMFNCITHWCINQMWLLFLDQWKSRCVECKTLVPVWNYKEKMHFHCHSLYRIKRTFLRLTIFDWQFIYRFICNHYYHIWHFNTHWFIIIFNIYALISSTNWNDKFRCKKSVWCTWDLSRVYSYVSSSISLTYNFSSYFILISQPV